MLGNNDPILKLNSSMIDCPICKLEENIQMIKLSRDCFYNCDLCGSYYMSEELAADPISDIQISVNKHLIRGYIRNTKMSPVFNTADDLRAIINNYSQLNDIKYKVDFILNMPQIDSKEFGKTLIIKPDTFPKYYCNSASELISILKALKEKKFIHLQELGTEVIGKFNWCITVTLDGVIYCNDKKLDSKQCFVAMWFNEDADVMFEATEDIFENSYLKEKGYSLLRLDKKYHSNDITDEILFEIKRSKFLIADLTGSRGGVYFEAGFAKGLGLAVILTCRDTVEDKNGIHFDLRNRQILFWNPQKIDIFKKMLLDKIGAEIL